jgi:hypothetical protein
MIRPARLRLRSRLAAAAREYAGSGWPVAPGAWWDAAEARYRCDQAGCVTQGLHPTLPGAGTIVRRCQVSVVRAAASDPAAVFRRWGHRPYSVLLPTGRIADVLELAPGTARRVLPVAPPGPIALLPDGRALLFAAVAPNDLTGRLAGAGALHHTDGSWVPMPPTPLAAGVVRWLRSPGEVGWRLPSSRALAEALMATADSG